MTNLTATVILSILRHLITLAGGVVFATKHESELVNLAGLLAAIIPAAFGAWKARRDAKIKDALVVEVMDAKEETAIVARIQSHTKPQ